MALADHNSFLGVWANDKFSQLELGGSRSLVGTVFQAINVHGLNKDTSQTAKKALNSDGRRI